MVDESLYSRLYGSIQHVEGAHSVGLEIEARIVHRDGAIGIGGKVEYQVHCLCRIYGLLRVAHVALYKRRSPRNVLLRSGG